MSISESPTTISTLQHRHRVDAAMVAAAGEAIKTTVAVTGIYGVYGWHIFSVTESVGDIARQCQIYSWDNSENSAQIEFAIEEEDDKEKCVLDKPEESKQDEYKYVHSGRDRDLFSGRDRSIKNIG